MFICVYFLFQHFSKPRLLLLLRTMHKCGENAIQAFCQATMPGPPDKECKAKRITNANDCVDANEAANSENDFPIQTDDTAAEVRWAPKHWIYR